MRMPSLKNGFSLIEMSVVLVIIGLIVGGILVGRDLIRQSEVRSISSDSEKIRSAIYAFQKKYDYWPGDFPRAESYWGTDTTSTPCRITTSNTIPKTTTCNGDGNGKLNPPTNGQTTCSAVDSDSFDQEPYRLWQHLANAGMLPGLYTGVNGDGGVLHGLVGVNVPASSKISGVGFQIMNFGGDPTTDIGWNTNVPFENVLFVGMQDTTNNCLEPILEFLTPQEAYTFDIKIDDGLPGTGFLRVYTHNIPRNPCTDSTTIADAHYIENDDSASCSLVQTINW